MKSGIVTFAGAGPGAADLLTVRCRDAIEEADVIVYAGSLVNPEVLKYAGENCEMYDSSGMTLDDTHDVVVAAARAGKKVMRLHTGDPSLYGATAEQMRRLQLDNVDYEVIPGVTAVFAAAAEVKAELTVPGHSQSLILTRRAGRTPVPEGEELQSLAAHGSTMALYLSVANIDAVVNDLLAGGYSQETPVAVVYRASWPDEVIVQGRLSTISGKVKRAGIGRQAIVLVGESLEGKGEESFLYSKNFSHGYRSAESDQSAGKENACVSAFVDIKNCSFKGRVAVYALTREGSDKALQLAAGIEDATVFLPDSLAPAEAEYCYRGESAGKSDRKGKAGQQKDGAFPVKSFGKGEFTQVVEDNWESFDGHIFIMAAGIVVRKIAPLLSDKTRDPAVVVSDENGRHAISLLSGHIGGANRLADHVAGVLSGQAVITTATDVQGVVAFDDLAMRYNWEIENPEAIKILNSLLLQKRPVALRLPEAVVEETYHERPGIIPVSENDALPEDAEGAVVLDDGDSGDAKPRVPVLYLRRKAIVVGVGCRKDTAMQTIEKAVNETLESFHLEKHSIETIASIDLKKNETGLLEFAQSRDAEIAFFSADELSQVHVPTPSEDVSTKTGSASVSEAAAKLAGNDDLLVPKKKMGAVTVAVASAQTSG